MTFSPEDITGQKTKCKYCDGNPEQCGHCKLCGAIGFCRHSSLNPKNNKSLPSLMEGFLSGLMSKPDPPDEELYLGDKPPANDARVRGIIDRQSVVDIAKKLDHKISEKLLIRICDAIFNDGIAMDTLQKIAGMSLEEEVYQEAHTILQAANLVQAPLPVETVEALVAVARALLQHVMTHHGGDYKDGSFVYDKTFKTPFMAWRVKETIQQNLLHSKPVLVNPGGFDSKKQVEQFYANFNIADIVLWDHDIWNAAIRGCQEAFLDTKVEKELVSSITPQFWQYDVPFTLGDLGQYQLHNANYDCVGFALLPITESEGILVDIKPDASGMEDVRRAIDEAVEKNAIKFARYGISVAIIFMPISDQDLPPEVRFVRPMFEGDPIEDLLHATVLAAAKFLTLKYVSKDDAPICKKELKQDRQLFKAVRRGKVQIPPIKIINLRRSERRQRTEEEAKSDSKRHYSCWWLVDAHWRKQWFPSLKRNMPVRILGYPKGNFEATFKPPREKVYKAVR